MMRSKLLLAAFALLSLGLLGGRAQACSCGGSLPPCGGQLGYLRGADGAVFAATVSELKPVYAEGSGGPGALPFPSSYRVRLAVDEMLIGGEAKELEVVTAGSTSSCGYNFKEGARYLVYAARDEGGALRVSQCSRTRPLEDAFDDLELLRAARRAEQETRIFGDVFIQPEQTESGQRREPPDLNAIKIVATSADGQQFETTTDERGRYRFTRLPFGRYKVRAWLNGHVSKEAGVEPTLSEENSCSEQGFYFRQGARATGAVSDADGRPAQLSVYVKLVAPTKGAPESLNTGVLRSP
ncbi:MAG TPA: carboxypeptidase regulatory-like domain-containing protein [Pyrinomonadaceae bacterium]|nr:carboxypeptidase regulatory-like domain-containing protein [Pyrinomonadaceae bacterium]